MKKMCEECKKETDWTINDVRGEMVCDMCGWVEEHNPVDANANSSTTMGDGRQSERVNALNGLGPGTTMNPFGDRRDVNGQLLSRETRSMFRRLARLDRSTQREKDPMYRQLVATLQELFGTNLAATVQFLTRATAQKLSPQQEAIRRTLGSSERKLLKCPKTSITRKGAGVKGDGDRQNLLLMAIAIAELAHEWFSAPSINRVELLNQNGLTQTQFKNAKSTISQHYKARCRNRFSPLPRTTQFEAVIAGIRADKLEIHSENLFGTLENRLSEREMLALNIVYWEMLTRIEEPSIDAHTSNMAESMLCSSVMLAALTSLGLEHQNLAALGRAVGDRSGAGIKSCLRNLQNAVNEGLYPQGKALFVKHSVNDLTRGLVSENVDDLGEVED